VEVGLVIFRNGEQLEVKAGCATARAMSVEKAVKYDLNGVAVEDVPYKEPGGYR
jgi:hypothetical protein